MSIARPSSKLHLLNLPPQLPNRIYLLVIPTEQKIKSFPVSNCSKLDECTKITLRHPALTQTCTLLRTETLPMFCGLNEIPRLS